MGLRAKTQKDNRVRCFSRSKTFKNFELLCLPKIKFAKQPQKWKKSIVSMLQTKL